MDKQAKIRQLLWRSKRGLLELELLLAPFNEADLAGLAPMDLEAYERLLEYDDVDLYAWLRGHGAVEDARLQPIVERIRRRHRG